MDPPRCGPHPSSGPAGSPAALPALLGWRRGMGTCQPLSRGEACHCQGCTFCAGPSLPPPGTGYPLDPHSPQSQATLGPQRPHYPLQAQSCPFSKPQEQQMSFFDEHEFCLSVRLCPGPQAPADPPKKRGEDQGSGCGGHCSGFMTLFHFILTLSFWRGHPTYEKTKVHMMSDGRCGSGSQHTSLTAGPSPHPPHPSPTAPPFVPWSLRDIP